MGSDLVALQARIDKLKGSDKLRLAAELLDRGQLDVAEALVEMVSTELSALRLLGRK